MTDLPKSSDGSRTDIFLPFGDGEYLFRLGPKEMGELQQACGAGILRVYGRVARGRLVKPAGGPDWAQLDVCDPSLGEALHNDIVQTIRLALIGGGRGTADGRDVTVTPAIAKGLVERYVDGQPLMHGWQTAFAILGARVVGVSG